jgi:hypothetical protein
MAKWARLGRSLGAPNWRNLGLEPWILNLASKPTVTELLRILIYGFSQKAIDRRGRRAKNKCACLYLLYGVLFPQFCI